MFYAISASFLTSAFKQIWPDKGDWNEDYRTDNPFHNGFKQIWPDKGDWNKPLFANITKTIAANLNKFDPIKGIETYLLKLDQSSSLLI